MPAHIQQNEFRNFDNIRVVLSEACYTRLLGDINLCGLHMGMDNNEYGTLLYGNLRVDQNGEYVFYFETPSEIDDYTPRPETVDVFTDSMFNEFVEKAGKEGAAYDCVAHIHTHPYLNESSRFLSEEDLNYYRSKFADIDAIGKAKEEKVYTLAGLLTTSQSNLDKDDDISFVSYDADTGEFHNVPNISVMINGEEKSLQRVNDSFVFPNGDVTNFDRTMISKPRGR